MSDVNGKSGQTEAGDLPFVLLGEECPDGPPDCSPVGEDAHDARALYVDLLRGGLVIDSTHHGRDPRLGAAWDPLRAGW